MDDTDKAKSEIQTAETDLSFENPKSIIHGEIIAKLIDKFIRNSLMFGPNEDMNIAYDFKLRRLTSNLNLDHYRSAFAISIDLLTHRGGTTIYSQEYFCKYMVSESNEILKLKKRFNHEIRLTNIVNPDFKLDPYMIMFETTFRGTVNEDSIAVGVFWPWEEGDSLHNILKPELNELTYETKHNLVIKYTYELFKLLNNLHNVGIVHRDFKPANIIQRNGENSTKDITDFKLQSIDFGISYDDKIEADLLAYILASTAPEYVTPADDTPTLSPNYDIAGFGYSLYKVLSSLGIYSPSPKIMGTQADNDILISRSNKMFEHNMTPLFSYSETKLENLFIHLSNLSLVCISPTRNNISLSSIGRYLSKLGIQLT